MSQKVYCAAFKTPEDLQKFLEVYKKPLFILPTSRIIRGIDPEKDRELIEQFGGEIEEDIQAVPFGRTSKILHRILWFLFGEAQKDERTGVFPPSVYEIVYASQITLSTFLRNGTFKVIICEWQLKKDVTSFDSSVVEGVYHTIRRHSPNVPIIFYVKSDMHLEIGNRFSNLKEKCLVLSAHEVDEDGLRFIVQNL